MEHPNEQCMQRAIQLGLSNIDAGGGPFGTVIVHSDAIIAEGTNRVAALNDPTAHAEIRAIQDACKTLDTFLLTGCTLYTTCEPCPMCLGAIYWAQPDQVFYAAGQTDAQASGFSDHFIYEQLQVPLTQRSIPMQKFMREASLKLFRKWDAKEDKTRY